MISRRVEVDLERNRIALTMRFDDAPRDGARRLDGGRGKRRGERPGPPLGEGKKAIAQAGQDARGRGGKPAPGPSQSFQPTPANAAMAEALARALKRG